MNKSQPTNIPEWLQKPNQERVDKLSEILKEWMKTKIPHQAAQNIMDRMNRHNIGATKENKENTLLEDKFKLENFDLIVWEYVSNK